MRHKKIILGVEDIVKQNDVFVMECPICGIIHASASEFNLMPQINTCEGKDDNNES